MAQRGTIELLGVLATFSTIIVVGTLAYADLLTKVKNLDLQHGEKFATDHPKTGDGFAYPAGAILVMDAPTCPDDTWENIAQTEPERFAGRMLMAAAVSGNDKDLPTYRKYAGAYSVAIEPHHLPPFDAVVAWKDDNEKLSIGSIGERGETTHGLQHQNTYLRQGSDNQVLFTVTPFHSDETKQLHITPPYTALTVCRKKKPAE